MNETREDKVPWKTPSIFNRVKRLGRTLTDQNPERDESHSATRYSLNPKIPVTIPTGLSKREHKLQSRIDVALNYFESIRRSWNHGPWEIADEVTRILKGGTKITELNGGVNEKNEIRSLVVKMLGRLVQGESQDAWIYNFIDDFVTVIEEYIANRPQYETEQVEHIAEIQTELTEASKEYVSLQEAYFEEQRCRKLLETELASLKTNYPKQVEEKVLWAVAEAWTNHNPAVPEPIVEIMKHRVEELGYKVISNNRN